MDCVVGSGPAGVACATALLERGRRVHLVDVGLELEPERARLVASLAATGPEWWNPATLARLDVGLSPLAGIPDKLVFGSDFPYRESDELLGLERGGTGIRASLALGGLSTVWGAALLPARGEDIADWPVALSELQPHYAAAARILHPAAVHDSLAALFPHHVESPGELQPSRQAAGFLRGLARNEARLGRAGIHFGRARLAVRAAGPRWGDGCVYCGRCLDGCPYGYIYSARDTVADLRRSDRFTYQPGCVVTSVREEGEGVVVDGFARGSREPCTIGADRVFLAAGPVATTGILLRSIGAYDRTLRMRDSQYFLLPTLLPRRVAGVHRERLHALSQVFLEIIDPAVSPNTVHLQAYSWSEVVGRSVRSGLGRLARPLTALVREFDRRLILLQGFLHSSQSSSISVSLHRRGTGADLLRLAPVVDPAARRAVRRVVRKLVRHAPALGVLPLPPLLHLAVPGRGFHAGGTFPMRRAPVEFETDPLGRPAGWNRVHAVDATVFPSIPATTITFTVMANAHRIASAS